MIKIEDKDLYKEKGIKKEHKVRSDNLKDLKEEIDKLRNELNDKIYKNSNKLVNTETLKLSKKLDKLIDKYLKD